MKKSSVISKFAVIVLILILGLIITSNSVFAANLSVNVNFDGKTIEMTSETPDMTWTVNNLLPGETEETVLTIANTGTRKVDVSFIATIESGEELANVLNIKVIKLANGDTQKEDEVFFNGKYSELMNISVSLEKGKSQVYKIVTSLPEEIGNEFQKKECKVKLSFRASGIEDAEPTPEPEPEKPEPIPEPEEPTPPKEVVTEEIKPVQTGESRAIYAVIAVLVIAGIVLVVTLCMGKKKEKNNNK